MYFAVLIFGAVLLGPFGAWAQCPRECVCEDTDLGRKAKCSGLDEVFPPGQHDTFRVLDISFNDISILGYQVFKDNSLQKLIYLNISHNNLAAIDVNAFSSMSELKILDLSHNELSYIESNAFSPLFSSLEELYLSNNQFTALPAGLAFTQLTLLDLSHCHQEMLPEKFLSGMKKLVNLNIASNRISAADRILSEASELINLASLDLRENNITALKNHDLLRLRKDITIELTGNPWVCGCDFLHMNSIYKQRAYSPELTCFGPPGVNCPGGSSTLRASLLTLLTVAAFSSMTWLSLTR